MASQIRSVEILTTRFDLNEVELTVWVDIESADANFAEMSLKGRLMGPRCLYSETIEIAYPLRSLSPQGGRLRAKVIIPEPSLWEPTTPFLYAGPIELHEANQSVDRAFAAHGIRHLALGTRGLRINGHPLTLDGVRRDQLDEVDALRLRQNGCNLVLAPLTNPDVWEAADRLGFLVIGVLGATADTAVPHLADRLEALSRHTSAFGWLVQPDFDTDAAWFADFARREKRTLIGVELLDSPLEPLAERVDFVAIGEGIAALFGDVRVPKLLLRESEGNGSPTAVSGDSDVLGSVRPLI